MKFPLESKIVILALGAAIIAAAFNFALLMAATFHPETSIGITYLYIALFIGSIVSAFVISPILIIQYRKNLKLQDAIGHYTKNKMQEIILAIDLVESNLIQADTEDLTYKDKTQMLDDVRAICKDVSGNLARKILDEAPTFSHDIATETKNSNLTTTK